jgi:hypothetical protein
MSETRVRTVRGEGAMLLMSRVKKGPVRARARDNLRASA